MASASSMPSANQRQDLKSLLECSICLETFDEPRTLPCLHSFCKKCLENFVDGKRDDELNCPVCRTKFALNKEEGVAGMTRNHFICNMVEVLSIQQQDKCIPCSHCGQASVGRCVTCEMFMCEKCFKPHNEYPGFKDHVVLTMEELSKPENQSKIKGKSYYKKHSAGPVALVQEIVKTNNEQWYSSDEGTVHLELLFQHFQEAGITPRISRYTIKKDMKFHFSGGYYLDVPPDFPKKMPTLYTPDGRTYTRKHTSEDVCRKVVESVVYFLRNSQQSSRRGGGGRGGSYY